MADDAKPLSKRAKASKFIQIAAVRAEMTTDGLYALDNNGRVWKYWPMKERPDGSKRYAFWGSVTTHRAPIGE
jgi:hypothetical protein